MYAGKGVFNPNIPTFPPNSAEGLHLVFFILSIIKNVERASTARACESRDFHVRGTDDV